jgi:Domain of unknown function (DUF4249)
MKIQFLILVLFGFFFASCESDITVDLPTPSTKVVVDGYVEAGLPVYIILSRNQGYFEPINAETINQSPEKDAIVIVNDGIMIDTLQEVDTIIDGSSVSGIYISDVIVGTVGRIYTLKVITTKNEILTSSAKLSAPVALDSVWFQLAENSDTLGFAFAELEDPDSLGNAYRWFAKRITKDDFFIAPFGSTFEDKFVNGTKFDFGFNRGVVQGSTATDDNNEEAGFFKIGDTIVVKFTSVDYSTFEFWRDAENQLSSSGSPFSVPSNIRSNIKGGLGLFSAYSASFDTIYAK